MATGMPVIMSRIGDAERMIEPEVTGLLVPQRDVDAIADAIRWLADHRDRLPEMGRAARHKAEREFSDRVGPARLLQAIEARMGPLPRTTERASPPATGRLESPRLPG